MPCLQEYVSIPTRVKAFQFNVNDRVRRKYITEELDGDRIRYYVTTIHGQKTEIVDKDYVIEEPDGVHYYPCKPDVFEKKYVPLVGG